METKTVKKKFDVISPDGFSIDREATYTSRKKALKAFEAWKERYKAQGYYSSANHGRIALEDLHEYCNIKEIVN
jgi:hypothetical protein